MEKISVEKLFEFYNDTFDLCGIYLLESDDITISYNIYEEFDINSHSFLSIECLKELYIANLISIEKLYKSAQLRALVDDIRCTVEWDFENFRTSKKWKNIMLLSDEIKNMI